jgi:nucleotide-binding universal stress UspA family protein
MTTLRRFLVPVDGSDSSNRAIDFAVALAKAKGAEIIFCYSVDLTPALLSSSGPYSGVDTIAPILDALESDCHSFLAAATARADGSGVAVATRELAGAATAAILEALEDHSFAAVVMGTHGRRGASRFFLGSTADGVLRRAVVPVFVVSETAATATGTGDPVAAIAVALDDSDPADAALDYALELAEPGTTRLVLTHAVDVRTIYGLAASQRYPLPAALAEARQAAAALIARAAARAKERGIEVESVVLEGEPRESLLDLVRTHGIGLLAIGTHGRRGLQRLLLGSVAEGVVRDAPVPVVVVRARAPAAAAGV